ncbi:MAG: YgiT-type zinc finger protein [Anaerovibrio sp.]|uniref:YgiT-type zinc finger protein n=1 Tax=Anaerovibrio sp. TaxID=1872532 RepID=UPI001B1B2D20|nr:YgiT-type zinc finger protein [Anaerovibrio sp.]
MADGTAVVIHGVPCYRCTQCGEEIFLFSTLDRIDEIKKNLGGKKEAFYAVA